MGFLLGMKGHGILSKISVAFRMIPAGNERTWDYVDMGSLMGSYPRSMWCVLPLGYRISQDSKIRFRLQVESYIGDWLFSESRLLASDVSRHKAMAYDNLCDDVLLFSYSLPLLVTSQPLPL